MEDKIWVFVCTHGKFGEALVESAEMIAGATSDVFVFSLMPGMPPEEYKSMLEKQLAKSKERKVLCLVDLFGGTPCTTCAMLSQSYDMQVISGLNLAMYIEVTSQMDKASMTKLKDIALHTLAESGKDVLAVLRQK